MMKAPKLSQRLLAVFLAFVMSLTCIPTALAAEVQATATTVQLTKTEGTVDISNSAGRSISLIEKMRLYNGYHVETEEKSYAWINLDSTKLSKLDAVSEMELRKSGKKLELLLNEGNLFFNVTEPLEDDESLNIRTSTIVVGIRGTCGWVKIIDKWTVEVYILEGTVTITVTDPVTGQIKEATITGGEKATCVVYPQDKSGDKCDIILDTFSREDIDGFVLVDVVPDRPLVEDIYEDSGIDLRDWPANPEERLKDDQEKVAEKLREIEKELEEQDEHISVDPVWPDPAPTPTPEPEPEDSGEEEPTPTPDPAPSVTGIAIMPSTLNLYLTSADGVDRSRGTLRAVETLSDGSTRPASGAAWSAATRARSPGCPVTVVSNSDGSATITATGVGTATVTATAGGYSAACTVSIEAAYPGGVTPSPDPAPDPSTICNVTFYANGGTWPGAVPVLSKDLQVAAGTALSEIFPAMLSYPNPSVADGVDFWNWNTRADGNGTPYDLSSKITTDVELYAQWADNSVPAVPTPGANYTITFDPNGGTVTPTSTTVGGYAENDFKLSSLPTPMRDGYTFVGWFTAVSGGTRVTTDTVFATDRTIYAHWEGGGGNDPDTGNVTYSYDDTTNTLTVSGTGAMNSYSSDASGNFNTPWSEHMSTVERVIIESGITNIGANAFHSCGNLTTVSIPDSVISINRGAFEQCMALTAINIPDSVTSIGGSAFRRCDSLTSITIPGSVTSMGNMAFTGCFGLTEVTIKEGVTDIGTNGAAFSNCTSLETVWLPSTITNINGAFGSCTKLNTVNYAGTQAQWGDVSKEGSAIPSGVTVICSDGSTTTARTATASPYSDVPLAAWYADAVLYCHEQNLMNGTDATHFTPDGTLTRAMMVTVLHRLAGTPAAGAASAFPDVEANQWYTQAVAWANQKGIVLGYPDGNFGTNDPVTHEQVALILQRYSGGEAVQVQGAENPGEPATRAEIAVTLMGFAKSGTLSTVSAIDVMCAPSGITSMGDGTILVTDTYHKQLWRVRLGEGTVYAGGETVTGLYGEPLGGYNDADLLASYFKEPWAAAPFLDGWAVSDTANNVVRLVRAADTQTLNGKTAENLKVTALGVAFDRPTGLAADLNGNLYVSDTGSGAVRKITPEGKVTTVATGLDEPTGLCWKSGALYIAETGADRVLKLQNGKISTVASGFDGPQGVAVGDDGTVYVADTNSGAVRVVRNGEVTTLVERDATQVRSGLTAPRGLLLQDGRLYICDGFARKVFVLWLG